MSSEVEHKVLAPHIFSLRFWVKLTEPEVLKIKFDTILSQTEFKVLNFSEHFFPVQGYTAIWLLAESHLAIHTFPQHQWSYIELSGCNESKTNKFKDLVTETDIELQWETDHASQSYPSKTKKKNNLNLHT